MPADLQKALHATGHTRLNGLWNESELEPVRQEALALWEELTSGERGSQLRQTGADPYSTDLRLSPAHPQIWNLLTQGLLPQLMGRASGWRSFRPLHFGLLCKRPGAPMTGWHRDKDFVPTSAPILTCWIPLTAVESTSGLTYAEGTKNLSPDQGLLSQGGNLQQLLAQWGAPFVDTEPFQPGDVDLHDGHVWHCGKPNQMGHERLALAACYIPAQAALDLSPAGFSPPCGEALRRRIREIYFAQLQPGALLEGDAHPLLKWC